jgi:hypothetical protein
MTILGNLRTNCLFMTGVLVSAYRTLAKLCLDAVQRI